MAPAWLVAIITELGVALTKWGYSELKLEVEQSREAAEQERLNGIRNGENAKRYQNAQTRQEQINAALNLINRNN